jgi:hypothetical protein
MRPNVAAHDVSAEDMPETKCGLQSKATFEAVSNRYEDHAHLCTPLMA